MLDGDAARFVEQFRAFVHAGNHGVDPAQNRVDPVKAFDFPVCFFARRDVANKAGKHRRRCRSKRRDCQLDWKLGAVGANRFELEPLAEDRAFARSEEMDEASTVRVPQTRRNDQFHHHLAERLLTRESEGSFRSRVEFDDLSLVVYGDEAVQRRFKDRALEAFTPAKFVNRLSLCRYVQVHDYGAIRTVTSQGRRRQ
jgi:hypothetical protein